MGVEGTSSLRTWLIFLLCLIPIFLPACPADAKEFHIPPGDLAAALDTFAKLSGAEVIYEADQIKGLRTKGADGDLTPQQAIDQLLDGTRLVVHADRSGAILIAVGDQPSEGTPTNAPRVAARPNAPTAKHIDPTAATIVEEVVVTARRREERLQTAPVAVTALTADTLERRGIVTLEQVSRIAPSLQVFQTSGTLGTGSVYVRGIGYNDSAIGQDSPVALYLDGVPFARVSTALMQLVSPGRVEVLRGAQGTLFGRNTTGGAILISTHTSSDEFSGLVKASYGRFDAKTIQVRLDSGLLGNSGIKFTAAYQHRQQDGTVHTGNLPSHLDPGAENSDVYFFKANGAWQDLSAILSADYNEMDGVPPELQVVDATTAVRNFIANSTTYGGCVYTVTLAPAYNLPCAATGGQQHMVQYGAALTLNYHFSDAIGVKSITSLRAYKRKPDPAAYGPVVRGNIGTIAAPQIATFNGLFHIYERAQSAHQISQEVQLLGTIGDFDYVGGLFYYSEVGRDLSNFRLPFVLANGTSASEIISLRQYTINSKSVAGFAQTNWRPSFVGKKLELSGGIRWTKDTRDFAQMLPLVRSGNLVSKNTSFLASASYRWDDDVMTYVRYSTGYRAGGFNPRAVAGVRTIFTPERVKTWEVGFKTEFFGKRVRLNGSAYYTKYRDLQVAQFIVPGTTTAGGTDQVNANARYQGFELEMQAVPIERLTLTAAVGYIDPKYSSFPGALTAGAVNPGCNPILSSTGTTIGQDCAAIAAFTHFPRTTLDLSANYSLPPESYGEWSVQVSYSYKSGNKWSAFNLPNNPFQEVVATKPFGLIDARIALSRIPLRRGVEGRLAVVGQNLTDKAYNVQGIDFGTYGTISWGKRRTFLIEGTVGF